MSSKEKGHWKEISSLWDHVGPPLRPSQEEVEYFKKSISAYREEIHQEPEGLVLGVTPEFFGNMWNDLKKVHAVDRSMAMVQNCFSGEPGGIVLGDWLSLPFKEESKDVVVLDGGLAFFEYPVQQKALLKEIERVLKKGGRFLLRPFTPPLEFESISFLSKELMSSGISDFNVMKFRLWMALRGEMGKKVRPEDVYKWLLEQSGGNLKKLAREQGWNEDHVMAVCSHEGSKALYYFPSSDQIISLTQGESNLVHVMSHHDEGGDGSCPVMVFKKK